MKKDIIFMGCRGYTKKYGGWETFIQNLIKNWNDSETRFFVIELVHTKEEEGYEIVDNVTCIRISSKLHGKPELLIVGIKFLFRYKQILKQFDIEKPILYVMGSHVGILFPFFLHQFKKSNTTIVHNPAGMEWKRKKVNFIMRKYAYVSRMVFIKSVVNFLVSDNPGIFSYYQKKIKGNKIKQEYIAYGTYEAEQIDNELPKCVSDYFNKFGIKPREYYLVLGRCVPENNYELILREFLKSDTNHDLVLICNNNYESKFFQKLRAIIPFENDPRIKFVGICYDRKILNYVRQLACGYIHGHSVGGTNPGLLEAMSTTDINMLYDVVFNREVGGDAALYFSENNSLSKLIEACDRMKVVDRQELGRKSKKRMKDLYTWDKIVNQYNQLFNHIVEAKQDECCYDKIK